MDWTQYHRKCSICNENLVQEIRLGSNIVVYNCTACGYSEKKPKICICSKCGQGILVFKEHTKGLNLRRDTVEERYIYNCDTCGIMKVYDTDLMMMED